MSREIHDAGHFDVEGSNHYGIVFQPHEIRDQVIREFFKRNVKQPVSQLFWIFVILNNERLSWVETTSK